MTELLAKWLSHREWYGTTSSDDDNEVDHLAVWLKINGTTCQLTLQHHYAIDYARLTFVPRFNLDGWKADEAKALLKAIGLTAFRLYRDGRQYLKLDYRSHLWLDKSRDSMVILDAGVEECLASSGRWVTALEEIATTNRSDTDIIADPPPVPTVRLVVTEERFQELLEELVERHPNPSRSMSQNYEWVHNKEVELREQLFNKGILIERWGQMVIG